MAATLVHALELDHLRTRGRIDTLLIDTRMDLQTSDRVVHEVEHGKLLAQSLGRVREAVWPVREFAGSLWIRGAKPGAGAREHR